MLGFLDIRFESHIDFGMAIDPLPKGDFVHHDFLRLQYICLRTRHVSTLRIVALSCNNKQLFTINSKTSFGTNTEK